MDSVCILNVNRESVTVCSEHWIKSVASEEWTGLHEHTFNQVTVTFG